jgi:hypothetical protein
MQSNYNGLLGVAIKPKEQWFEEAGSYLVEK